MSTLQEERDLIFTNVFSGKKPSRVPIMVQMNIEAALEYFDYSILRDFYSPEKCYEAADKMAELLNTDTIPVSPATTPGAVFRYIGQKFMVAGADGFFQHPDISPMEFEEYPEFSEDVFKFIVEKIHPRVFTVFDDHPELAHLKIKIARDVVNAQFAGMGAKLIQKHERTSVCTSASMSWAPFDFIADYIRSFSTMLVDMRRKPQWVLDACEAVLVYLTNQAKALPPAQPGKTNEIMMPLHMPPFMRPKDVEKFYWPTFRKLVEAIEDSGHTPSIFFEENWDPHMELIPDLPGRYVAKFENSNLELIAKTVPDRVIKHGAFPTVMLRSASKQECTDTAKEMVDILAPGGNYIFCTNKRFIRGNDIAAENLQAVIECVREYGRY